MSDPIDDALRRYRYEFTNEKELQDGVAEALRAGCIPFIREAPLGPGDYIDFVSGKVGVEVKIRGSLSDLTRQLARYAASNEIDRLVVVTTKQRLRRLPDTLEGKPISVVYLCPL